MSDIDMHIMCIGHFKKEPLFVTIVFSHLYLTSLNVHGDLESCVVLRSFHYKRKRFLLHTRKGTIQICHHRAVLLKCQIPTSLRNDQPRLCPYTLVVSQAGDSGIVFSFPISWNSRCKQPLNAISLGQSAEQCTRFHQLIDHIISIVDDGAMR